MHSSKLDIGGAKAGGTSVSSASGGVDASDICTVFVVGDFRHSPFHPLNGLAEFVVPAVE